MRVMSDCVVSTEHQDVSPESCMRQKVVMLIPLVSKVFLTK